MLCKQVTSRRWKSNSKPFSCCGYYSVQLYFPRQSCVPLQKKLLSKYFLFWCIALMHAMIRIFFSFENLFYDYFLFHWKQSKYTSVFKCLIKGFALLSSSKLKFYPQRKNRNLHRWILYDRCLIHSSLLRQTKS